MSIRLSDRIIGAHGTLIDNLVAIALEAIAMASVHRIAVNPGCPIKVLHALLAALPPAPKVDEFAADAIRTDYQHFGLKSLAEDLSKGGDPGGWDADDDDDTSDEPICGTYDARETAQEMSKIVLMAISNARRPLAR